MADILTHVIVGYIIGTLLSFRYEWMRPTHVTLVMIGALSPDFVKIELVIPDVAVESLLGIPFSWSPLHTLGGSVIVILIGSLFVAPDQRWRALALFAVGAFTHHALDVALMTATGYSYAVFWPITEYRPPAGGLYLSSDRWPVLLTGFIAIVVWTARRRYTHTVFS